METEVDSEIVQSFNSGLLMPTATYSTRKYPLIATEFHLSKSNNFLIALTDYVHFQTKNFWSRSIIANFSG